MKHPLFTAGGISVVLAFAFVIPSLVSAFTPDAPPPGFVIETILGGLELPTKAIYAPDGTILVAQKSGTVVKANDGVVSPEPVIMLPNVNDYGDRGLLSIALDPNFPTKPYLYLLYTYENDPTNPAGPKTAQLVRTTLNSSLVAVPGTTVVLLGKVVGDPLRPSCASFAATADCIASDSSSHSVADLAFASDGKLFVSIGDGASFSDVDPLAHRSLDLQRLNGKVLRINPANGAGYKDNPYYNGNLKSNRTKVWNLGLRNPFRIAFRPSNGALLLGDVGWNTYEEVNIGTKGANFGWPCREGADATPGYPAPGKKCAASGYTLPLYAYPHNPDTGSGSIIGGSFYTGTSYPAEYQGVYFYGDFSENYVKYLVLDDANALIGQGDFLDDAGGPVAFTRDPEGNIVYAAIYTGELRRIVYVGDTNRAPVAKALASPTSGPSPLRVTFIGSGSVDPDGDALSYLWDFGDGEISTLQNPQHTYLSAVDGQATLTVTDTSGATGAATVRIVAGNEAPSAMIASPVNGSSYGSNQIISLSGIAEDPEDGALPESAYTWEVVLHHNVHTHLLETLSGSHPTFLAPDHGPDPDVYLEVRLKATDSTGLVGTKSINLFRDASAACGAVTNHLYAVSDGNDLTSSGTPAVATYVGWDWTALVPGATWIWNSYFASDPMNGETETFTKEFVITATPLTASIAIAADDNYEASLNGTTFATVADLNNFMLETQDAYDVLPLLRAGTNTLAVTVHNAATGDTDPTMNAAGLLYKLDIGVDSCRPY